MVCVADVFHRVTNVCRGVTNVCHRVTNVSQSDECVSQSDTHVCLIVTDVLCDDRTNPNIVLRTQGGAERLY